MYTFILILCFTGSYLLFTNGRKSESGNLFLAILYLLMGIQTFSHINIIKDVKIQIAAIFFLNTASLSFLIGPCFYFYVIRLILPNFKLSKKHLVHLIPFLIFFIDTFPYIISPFSTKIELVQSIQMNPIEILDIPLLIGNSSLFYFSRPIILIFYLYMTSIFFQENKSTLKNQYGPFQADILKRWVQIMIICSSVIYLSNLIFIIHNYFTRDINGFSFMTQIAACCLLLMCIQLFINPYVMYGFTQVKYFSSESLIAKLYFVGEKNDYSQEWINNLCERFNQLDRNKSYLKAGYTIQALQEELKIPNKSIRYYLNNIARLSFTDWKNNKRIEYAIQLMNEGYLQKYTREHLAKECGFLSRSNFNQAIKKFKEKK